MSSENVDSFAQEYLERARKRREMLAQKLADTSPRRKRTVPLLESQNVRISPPKPVDDDSPNKRQCLRDDLQMKPDTPAIPGVRSRMKNLISERSNWENGEIQHDPAPVARSELQVERTTTREVSPAPGARRNRLAALANSINNWEDDLTHHVVKPEEKPKKVWERPRTEDPLRRTHQSGPTPSASASRGREVERKTHQSGPSKPTRTYEHEAEERHTRSPSPVKSYSPVKTASPVRRFEQDGEKVISSITVTLGGTGESKVQNIPNNQKSRPYGTCSPIKEYAKVASPIKVTSNSNSDQVTRSVSPAKATARRDASPVKPAIANRVAALQKDASGKRRESFEPSAQPVSARLAGWQDRVNLVESEKMDPHNNAASRIHIQPKVISPKKPEPTSSSIHSRMADWEHRSQEDEREKVARGVHGTPRPVRPASPVRSPVKPATAAVVSPTKVAPAAKAIHSKLQQLQQGWKQNEISEQIKQQKQADMAVLENRWKNGVLDEEQYTIQSQPKQEPPTRAVPSSGGAPPPPPPLPSQTKLSSLKKKVQSPQKSPVKASAKTPRTPRNVSADTKQKIRAVHHEMIGMVMGEQPGAGKSANQDPHFENKLKTMGFEIDSKSETGHVATLDLKEQREKDRLKREANKGKVTSPKKQAVNVTEEVVTSYRFNDDKVTAKTTVTEPRTPVSVKQTMAMTPGGSLYSLIRKQTPGQAAMNTPTTASRPRPSSMNKFHDSFSSDETSFEEDAPPVPTKITITTDLHRKPSSCSEYSETQTETSQTTQSDDEYSDTEYSMDETEATQSDSESYDESGGMSGFLDEAMDDTVTEPPVAAPRRQASPVFVARKLPPEAHPGHPDHRPPTSAQHSAPQHHQAAAPARQQPPPKHPRVHEQQREEKKRVAFTSPGGSTYRSDSSGSERSMKREIVHSVDTYRNSANIKRNAPEPRLKIIRRSEHYDPDDEGPVNEKLPYIPPESAKQRLLSERSNAHVKSLLQELKDLVDQEQIVIKQTSNALNQCFLSDPVYAGPDRAVECHRLLLQACKKREAYLTEMERLRSGRQTGPAGPKGSLTISDIRLPLKREFVNRLHAGEVNTVHYFIVLFRQGAHVIFTQMVSTEDRLVSDSLDIPNLLPNIEIRQDFRIDMEVYSMSVTREVPDQKTPKKKKGMTPKKMMSASKKHHPAFQSPGGPTAVRTTDFQCIANLPITLSCVNKSHFSLDRVPYASPMYGTIHIKLRCLLEALVEEKGFLTMFEDVSGMGAWHRRWCVLRHNTLSFWKYPDDSKFKDPIGQMDLKQCITDEVGLISRDQCARPNTFELLTVRRQQRGESDTLISRCYNTMTTTKMWLSADTKEDRYVWCHKLNEALRNLRAWNPDALRPIKRQPKPATDTHV